LNTSKNPNLTPLEYLRYLLKLIIRLLWVNNWTINKEMDLFYFIMNQESES
jgi:hypothetical protein